MDWPFGARPPAAADLPAAPPARPEILNDETPLDVLLRIMRTSEDERTQLQAAQLAAPYVHAKPAPVGKKDAKKADAKAASGGSKFATAAPPRLVAANGNRT